MPAFASITINDGQAAPVAHTFTPTRIDEKGVASFFDRSGGVAIGFTRFTVRLTEPQPAKSGVASDAVKRVYRFTTTIDVPKLESATAVPTVAYVHTSRLSMDLPERGAIADRKDLLAYQANSLGNATIKSIVENLESFY